jgi:hypothetical protein
VWVEKKIVRCLSRVYVLRKWIFLCASRLACKRGRKVFLMAQKFYPLFPKEILRNKLNYRIENNCAPLHCPMDDQPRLIISFIANTKSTAAVTVKVCERVALIFECEQQHLIKNQTLPAHCKINPMWYFLLRLSFYDF